VSELLERLRSRPDDQDLWAEFFRRFHPPVYYEAHRSTGGDVTAAEELVQETFLRFIEYGGLAKVADDRSARAYLRVIACRVAYSQHLKRYRRGEADGTHLSLAEVAELSSTQAKEGLIHDLEVLVEELDKRDRVLLSLLVAGYSTSEIAARFSLPYSATAVRIHRLRRRLAHRAEHLGLKPVKKEANRGS
jgi:RNA polymerase sigma factor (sigma-70 family)